MKIPLTLPIRCLGSLRRLAASNRGGALAAARPSQRGVALILTLILLSVITFLAVAFLAISRRERAAVTVSLDQTRARQAAETATERAKAQIMAQILATTNKWNYGLTVSTNFINPNGFQNSGPGYTSPLNVSYVYPNGLTLTDTDLRQNIANLLYDPRAPVVLTDRYGSNDFRYFLNLNRNLDANKQARYDTNGWGREMDTFGNPVLNASLQPVTNFFVGDPEWIGMLDKLGLPHSNTNRFIGRYAYLVLPAGKELDLNAIHNQAKNTFVIPPRTAPLPGAEGFLRNHGLGTWELNLAATLEDLNTNSYAWGTNAATATATNFANFYDYSTNANGEFVSSSGGPAFGDALGLLRHRYSYKGDYTNGSYTNLQSALGYFGNQAIYHFTNDFVDAYANGPLLAPVTMPNDWHNDPYQPWPGADNPNAFFTTQDLFDATKVSSSFTNRLVTTGNNNSSYDRYTFYRLLTALGADSGSEPPDLATGLPSDQAPPKINLNYDNLTGAAPLSDWVPEVFFTNAADRLLRDPNLHPYAYAGLSVTNIPVWPAYTNYYTPAVHRLLQVAANLYDATTTNAWPSVFRPIFRRDANDNVFIVNYHELPDAQILEPGVMLILDPSVPADLSQIPLMGTPETLGVLKEPMLVGVPLVIGAKKGLPNFNEFAMQTVVLMERKLQLTKDSAGKLVSTNQMYFIGVSNMCGVEVWNSYATSYTNGTLRMSAVVDLTTVLSNATDVVPTPNPRTIHGRSYSDLAATYHWPQPTQWDSSTRRYLSLGATRLPSAAGPQPGFWAPLRTNLLFIPNNQYWVAEGKLHPENETWPASTANTFPVPNLTLLVKAQVRYLLVDTNNNRILDYINLANLTNQLDLTSELIANSAQGSLANVWITNRQKNSFSINAPTLGIINQIRISTGEQATSLGDWNNCTKLPVSAKDKDMGIDAFREFLGLSALKYPTHTPASLTNQTPFNPVRQLSIETRWQVNDPLVHYLPGDLGRTNVTTVVVPPNSTNYAILGNLGFMNIRTRPWAGNPEEEPVDRHAFNLALKDPQVMRSDYWEFPTNKLGNLGWIGRVHRGTPWQTIYLKSPDVEYNQASGNNNPLWVSWSGNWSIADAAYTRPVTDRFLLEHFTASLGANSTKGQLSINNSELAAWSAVFAGVPDLHSTVTDTDFDNDPARAPQLAATPILPAGLEGWNSPLGILVDAINRTRNTFPLQTFTNLGNILAVPELTTNSPFLSRTTPQMQRGLTDAAYERLPQQVLSLLRGDDDPRFVVYAFGQSLQPAPASILTDSPHVQLCTNYVITAESATRTVIRIVGAPTPGDTNPNIQPRVVIESFNNLPPD